MATAVITAECTGQLLGRSVGGAPGSVEGTGGLFAAYLLFAVALVVAAGAARRASTA